MKELIEELRYLAGVIGDADGAMLCQAADAIESQSATIALYETTAENYELLQAKVDERVRDWNLASDTLPACSKQVLAYYLNSHGMERRIRAMYVKRFTVEAEDFADPDTQCVEYSEQDDCYYTTEGWYELIDNWPDYASCAVIEGVITHWTTLPAAPSAAPAPGECVAVPVELSSIVIELCDVIENKAELPLHKWALKSAYLIGKVRTLLAQHGKAVGDE